MEKIYLKELLMPAIAKANPSMSTGHGSFPPSPATGAYSQTAFVNNQPCQLVDVTLYQPHTNGDDTHPPHGDTRRIVSTGSSTLIIENKQATMIGKDIDCDDVIAWGADNAFIE